MSSEVKSSVLELVGQPLELTEIAAVAFEGCEVRIAPQAFEQMLRSRSTVEELIRLQQTAYGINTGFGKLADVRIQNDELATLQTNLVRSHACGLGEPLTEPEVRAMLLLRANVLAKD